MAVWIYGVGLLKRLDLNSRVHLEIVYFCTCWMNQLAQGVDRGSKCLATIANIQVTEFILFTPNTMSHFIQYSVTYIIHKSSTNIL